SSPPRPSRPDNCPEDGKVVIPGAVADPGRRVRFLIPQTTHPRPKISAGPRSRASGRPPPPRAPRARFPAPALPPRGAAGRARRGGDDAASPGRNFHHSVRPSLVVLRCGGPLRHAFGAYGPGIWRNIG